MNLRLYISPL